MKDRHDRRHRDFGGPPDPSDIRTPGQIDRDRLLYSSALRRLAGVTQVAGAEEGHLYHNRLTHTLQVAQLARRLAERHVATYGGKNRAQLDLVDPEICECAALAHDLGHPPFGHAGEDELSRLVKAAGDADGFEGNAQTFRIVTVLSAHRQLYPGLNLCRATLRAILKYPWHQAVPSSRSQKFGAYRSEAADLRFAGAGWPGFQSAEASIMDCADDIAYSVHDVEDFYRAGLIPLETLRDSQTSGVLIDKFLARRATRRFAPYRRDLLRFFEYTPFVDRYRGALEERQLLRTYSSWLISRFVVGVSFRCDDRSGIRHAVLSPENEAEVEFLKYLVRTFVIDRPGLASQQYGQRMTIRLLFGTYFESLAGDLMVIPEPFQSMARQIPRKGRFLPKRIRARLAADIVSSFTDHQAWIVARRLSGAASGSIRDHY